MEITKDYLATQINNLEKTQTEQKNVALQANANAAAIDGALQALKGLVAYIDIPLDAQEELPLETVNENPDAQAV